jgi:hypothetical protein
MPNYPPRTIAADQVSYEDLYARWEVGNWRASELDFSTDRDDWRQSFTELERTSALWTYSMFFHGEDSVFVPPGSDERYVTSFGFTLARATAGCPDRMAERKAEHATDGWPDQAVVRTTAIVACALVPLGLIVWLPTGPLAAGWAKRAGTPRSLLGTGAASGTLIVRPASG